MAQTGLRKIRIGDDTYLWKRTHLHITAGEPAGCVEKVVIYLEGYKKAPLQLLFSAADNLKIKADPATEKWCVGYPDAGVIWLYREQAATSGAARHSGDQQQTKSINLNRPAVIAGLISYCLQTGWQPKESTRPYRIEAALKLLETIILPD